MFIGWVWSSSIHFQRKKKWLYTFKRLLTISNTGVSQSSARCVCVCDIYKKEDSVQRAECKLCDQPPITLSQGTGRTRKYSSLNWPLGHSVKKKRKRKHYIDLMISVCSNANIDIDEWHKVGWPTLACARHHWPSAFFSFCLVVKPSGHHLKLALKMQNYAKAMFKPMRWGLNPHSMSPWPVSNTMCWILCQWNIALYIPLCIHLNRYNVGVHEIFLSCYIT